MRAVSRVREVLLLFSVNVGLDDAVAQGYLERMLSIPGRREEIRRELTDLEESGGPWIDLLANEDYDVDDPESEEEARAIVLDIFKEALGDLGQPR